MNVAVYHGLPNMHYEMLGYLIDYFYKIKNESIKVTYYLNVNECEKYEWLKVYEDIFKIKINWRSIYDFNPNNNDLIFLVTDNDYTFKQIWFINHSLKIVSINHLDINRHNYNVLLNLHLRYINSKPCNKWVLPCYQGINKVDKLESINKKRIKIACVGQFIPPSTNYLINLFENTEELEFNIICRHNIVIDNFDFTRYTNYEYSSMIRINVFINMKTEDMINLIKECSYIFCCKAYNLYKSNVEKKYNYDRTYRTISGIIPLGLSFGCQLILPSNWNHGYNLKTTIIYNEDNPIKIKLVRQTKQSLDLVYNDLYNVINNKNILFDNIMRLINKDFIYNTNNNSWFSNVCNKLNIAKPNIFIETGTYLGDGINNVKNDFREVHSIELNEIFYNNALVKFKDEPNVLLHLGDSAEVMDKIIYDINEPILFYLDAHFSGGETAYGKEADNGCPLLRELSALSKRKYNDIVIIDDMRLMNKASYSGIENDKVYPLTFFDFRHVTEDSIKKSYNRPSNYYNLVNYDRLIIVPISNLI